MANELEKVNRSFYVSVHCWLKHNFGVATKCESKDCVGKSKIYQWSKKRDVKYDFKRKNFIQLCKSCHAKYDISEKTRKKMRQSSRNAKKTHCKRGHLFDEENTIIQKSGARSCRKCCQANKVLYNKTSPKPKEWRERNKEKMRKYHREYARKYRLTEKYKKTTKKYYNKHKERLNAEARKRRQDRKITN